MIFHEKWEASAISWPPIAIALNVKLMATPNDALFLTYGYASNRELMVQV